MRKIYKSFFAFIAILLTQCTCLNPSPRDLEDFDEVEKKKDYTFENLLNYNDVDKVWDSKNKDHTIVYSVDDDTYGETLKEYDYFVDNFEHSNEKTKIGNFDYISIFVFPPEIMLGTVNDGHYREIYITDVQFGESLIEFSDKNNYEKIQEEDNEKIKRYIGKIDFGGNKFNFYNSGFFSFIEDGIVYLSKESVSPFEIVNYAYLNHGYYEIDDYFNFYSFLFKHNANVLIFIKNDQKVVVTEDEIYKNKSEYFVNFDVNEELDVEAYFTNDYKKNSLMERLLWFNQVLLMKTTKLLVMKQNM